MLRLQRSGVLLALVVIVVAFQVVTDARGLPSYLSISNIHNILDQSAVDGFLVIGMTVLLITGNFDLSIGAAAGLAAGIAVRVSNGDGILLAIVLAIAVGLAVGLVNAAVVVRLGVNAFITTLGTMTILEGVLLIYSKDSTLLENGSAFASLGQGTWAIPEAAGVVVGVLVAAWGGWRGAQRWRSSGLDVASFLVAVGGVIVLVLSLAVPKLLTETRESWLMLALTVVVALFLRYTIVGRRLYAVGGNLEAARLSGIRTSAYRTSGFLATGLAAGFVGLVYAGKYGAVDPTALSGEELPVLAAAILGGTSLFGGSGFVSKSVLGVFILAALSNGFNVLSLNPNYQYLVQGAVIIAAAAIYTVGGTTRRRDRVAEAPDRPDDGQSVAPGGTPAVDGVESPARV